MCILYMLYDIIYSEKQINKCKKKKIKAGKKWKLSLSKKKNRKENVKN